MLSVLRNVIELDLRALLERPGRWQSVHVTYHPPRVERLWVQHGTFRVLLHRIHPCEEGEPLFHPHPWPSAVRVVSGQYEHQLSHLDTGSPGPSPAHGPVLCRAVLSAGDEYEMTEPSGWHSVRPVAGPSDSVMVTGPLYADPVQMPSPPTEKQGPLSAERFNELFEQWRERVR